MHLRILFETVLLSIVLWFKTQCMVVENQLSYFHTIIKDINKVIKLKCFFVFIYESLEQTLNKTEADITNHWKCTLENSNNKNASAYTIIVFITGLSDIFWIVFNWNSIPVMRNTRFILKNILLNKLTRYWTGTVIWMKFSFKMHRGLVKQRRAW